MITPLFALDAEDLYDAGQFTDAAALCRQGLELYPEYASGYAVLYRSLIAIEQYDDALSVLHRGLLAMPANRILMRLSAEHTQMMKHHSPNIVEESYDFPTVIGEVVTEDAPPIDNQEERYSHDDIFDIEVIEADNHDAAAVSVSVDSEQDIAALEEEFAPDRALAEPAYEDNTEPISFENVNKTETIVAETSLPTRTSYPPLRVMDSADSVDKVMIRASSVGLIPGLHFAPMMKRRVSHISSGGSLPPLPPFRQFAPRLISQKVKNKTPLEELAARLEKARISIVHEEHVPTSSSGNEIVSTATETVAKIYESQGAYALAVKVYQQLARSKPELCEEYEAKIRMLHQKIEDKKQLSSSR
jgi:tetratricopeptide (TPR) repeat protein